MRYPYVVAVTANGFRLNVTAASHTAERYPIRPTVDIDAVRLSWRPGQHDAQDMRVDATGVLTAGGKTELDVRGVRLIGARIHEDTGSGPGAMVADLGGGSLTGGALLTSEIPATLRAGASYLLTLQWEAPVGAVLSTGVGTAYQGTTLGGAFATFSGRVTGSPALIYSTPETPRVTVVLGDSNTAGLMLGRPMEDTAYKKTAERVGEVVVALGYSGETMNEQASSTMQLDAVLDLCRDPATGERLYGDAAIIQSGINDCAVLGGGAASALRTNVVTLIDRIRSGVAAQVWVATLPGASGSGWPSDNSAETSRRDYNAWLRGLAPGQVRYLAGVLDYDKALASPTNAHALSPEYSVDMLHYNVRGHDAIGALILKVIGKPRTAAAGGGATFRDAKTGGLYQIRDLVSGKVVTARRPPAIG